MKCDKCGTEYEGEECPECKEAQSPFYRKKEEKGGDIFTIRLNAEERATLEDIKRTFDLTSDGAALKMCAFIGWRVLHTTLGADNLRWISSGKRTSRGAR